MTTLNLAGRFCFALTIATLATAANASVVLTADTGKLTAVSATEQSSSGTPTRASWDLATMKGARSATPQPIKVTLDKVSLQDFSLVCSPKGSARTAAPPTCKLATATIEDGGRSFTLTDVTLTSMGCDSTCSPGTVHVEVSFMAINEKGLPGTRTGTKGSTK